MDQEEIEFLEGGKYLSFGTRKRSGEFVNTPVWFAPLEGSYYLFSAADAGKVKRLRNFSEARVAACTVSGTLTGPWLAAQAKLLEGEDEAVALRALHNKYGLAMKLTDLASRLTGKYHKRRYIRVTLAGDADEKRPEPA